MTDDRRSGKLTLAFRPGELKREVYNTCSGMINMRPMDHIAHLRQQFKSINTFDYIITLIKIRKKNY